MWQVGTLPAGHSRTIHVTATLAAIAGRRLCNSVGGDVTIRDPAIPTACTIVKPGKPKRRDPGHRMVTVNQTSEI